MYIIISNTLETNELFTRAKFNTRLDARKNLLKTAQNWLCYYKAGQEWEIVGDIKDASMKTKYYIEMSVNKEDAISLYEKREVVQKGWLYDGKAFSLHKILIFSIVELEAEKITENNLFEKETRSEPILFNFSQKNLIADLKDSLSKRRLFVE